MNSLKQFAKQSALRFGSLVNRNRNSKLLYYHDVYCDNMYTSMGTHFHLFNEQLEVVREEGYQIVSRIDKSEGEVAILFDDGFRGIYDARDFFYEHNIFPTVFLAVDLIGREGYLSHNEILELQKHGFIFECHGWSHKELTSFSDEELVKELKGSKDYLSDFLQKEINEICLPIGYFSDHLLRQIQAYGYNVVYSSVPGSYNELVLGIMRPRYLLQHSSPQEVRFILRGGGDLLRSHYLKQHHVVR